MTPAAFDALPAATTLTDFQDQFRLLEKGLFVAAHFDRADHVQHFIARVRRVLQTPYAKPMMEALDSLAREALRALRKLGRHKESNQLLDEIARVLLKGGNVANLDPQWGMQHPEALTALLHVAAGWYYFGHDGEADKVFTTARTVLLAPLSRPGDPRPLPSQDGIKRIGLARAYASALSQAPVERAQSCFEELFRQLKGISDTWTSSSHYLLSQLLVIEAVVLAVVSDDFTIGPAVRRWLDDDEYLVRRRIHRDVRELVSH